MAVRTPRIVVWAGRKAEDPPAVVAARTAMLDETEDEYRRLLYVAMTRAADRLIVGGCMPGNMNSVRKYSWYDLIGKGLEQFRIAASGDRDSERHGEALFAGGGCRACHGTALRRQRRHRSSCRHGCGRRRTPERPGGQPVAAVRSRRR